MEIASGSPALHAGASVTLAMTWGKENPPLICDGSLFIAVEAALAIDGIDLHLAD